ncbi:hypothetical protein C8J56DRAFT_885595 [Mycena floridula]|nr:hypothetical protein C8J56DRAFT_885595 [Mycena floridula]
MYSITESHYCALAIVTTMLSLIDLLNPVPGLQQPAIPPGVACNTMVSLRGSSWTCLSQDFAYSLGEPKGGTSSIKVYPLKDDKGEQVLCQRRYSTCQGIKNCPFINQGLTLQAKTKALHLDLCISFGASPGN